MDDASIRVLPKVMALGARPLAVVHRLTIFSGTSDSGLGPARRMGLTTDEPSADFAGLRVFAFESRMAAETLGLIERFGGRATVVPAMREVPVEDNCAAFEFGESLLCGRIDLAIFLTGVGVRELFRVLGTRYAVEQLVGALARVVTVARGPKPLIALREIGLAATITVPEPNTWREI